MTKIGIIGGSGLYDIDGLEAAEWVSVDSPWGAPSDAMLCGVMNGVDMVFLPRHGRGHVHSPSTVPYRANIDALKRLGVTDVVSVSACGSFREDMAPGDFVIVSDFIDRTFAREKSFFGRGCVAHVSVAHPVCSRLGDACEAAGQEAGVTVHRGGTYLAMEGPQFSSMADAAAKQTVAGLPGRLGGAREVCPRGCDRALDFAIMTAPEARDPAVLAKLDAVAGRVL